MEAILDAILLLAASSLDAANTIKVKHLPQQIPAELKNVPHHPISHRISGQ
jgi:hypothetical protein